MKRAPIHPLTRYRRRRRLSLREFAASVKLSPSTISRLENGVDPTLKMIRRLRDAGVTVTANQFLRAGDGDQAAP